MVGFVDLISIWVFAAGDSVDTSTWLNKAHRAKSVGLKGGSADAMYAHSMTRRYPTAFTGREEPHSEHNDNQDVRDLRSLAGHDHG
jgi:hypothetical protein